MKRTFEMQHGPSRTSATIRAVLVAALLLAPSARMLAQDVIATGSDPRVGLAPGAKNSAGMVQSNMKLISFTPKPVVFDTARGTSFVNSDLAFGGAGANYVYQGNFNGFMIWDVSNPAAPVLKSTMVCPTDQGDPSIVGNLLFISSESGGARTDCQKGGVQDGKDRARGVRIFDVSDPAHPFLVKNIQTCRGSHTHTLVPHPTDKNIMYIYVGGSSGVRDSTEAPGDCSAGTFPDNPKASNNRIDIIKVPLNDPKSAEVVTFARIFVGLGPTAKEVVAAANAAASGAAADAGAAGRGAGAAAAGRGAGAAAAGRGAGGGRGAADTTAAGRGGAAGARGGRGGGGGGRGGGGPGGCHDLTAYPAFNLVAGSCGSRGILLNVKNPEKPVRLDAISDTNFGLWHTAVFSNDGKKVVYTDEWGGGTSARCRITDPQRLGGNTILTISPTGKYTQHAYFKMLAAQTEQENCVSHNGGLVPVPGRDLMVQGWYQGGVDVFDFTNPDHPVEIAYFDRGPIPDPANPTRLVIGGSWGAYYWNGYIYSSELSRGFDILELTPSEHLSQNELDAAKLARMGDYNPQSQPKVTWPAAFPVVRSYLDQLVRNEGLPSARTKAITASLLAAEKATGAARGTALRTLALAVDKDVAAATDKVRVRAMAAAIRDLAAVSK